MKTIAKESQDRYQTMQELAVELESFLKGKRSNSQSIIEFPFDPAGFSELSKKKSNQQFDLIANMTQNKWIISITSGIVLIIVLLLMFAKSDEGKINNVAKGNSTEAISNDAKSQVENSPTNIVSVNNTGTTQQKSVESSSIGSSEVAKPKPVADVPGESTTETQHTAGERKLFTDLEIPFRWCPPGTFEMGDDKISTTLSKGYWLGETEVTQGQWEQVMGTTPWKGEKYVKEGKNYPATYVNWDDVKIYSEKLTQLERQAGRLKSNQSYRLPTEAEWEFACRAGTKTAYSFGDAETSLGQYAWYDENVVKIKEEYAHEVGSKRANPWNLQDMHGNVWEWCSDWYGDKLTGGRNPQGASTGSNRVVRGGGWCISSRYCRSAIRDGFGPLYRGDYLGFRLVLSSVE
jgi:formylglycine-generating enzyme required for sulfatase activity